MTISSEDYLKSIFKLQQRHSGDIKTSVISAYMDLSAGAVSEMLKRLSDKKLLQYEPYKGVRLTEKGRQQGQNMVRRHRILEMYLHEKLGFSWDEVHEEAERMEHSVSDTLINRMDKALGFPRFDPHGDPIPSMDGSIPDVKALLLLADQQDKFIGQVARVSDSDSEFLSYSASIGLSLNTEVRIQKVHPFDQSMSIYINGKEQHISHYVAKQIWVYDPQKTKESKQSCL